MINIVRHSDDNVEETLPTNSDENDDDVLPQGANWISSPHLMLLFCCLQIFSRPISALSYHTESIQRWQIIDFMMMKMSAEYVHIGSSWAEIPFFGMATMMWELTRNEKWHIKFSKIYRKCFITFNDTW